MESRECKACNDEIPPDAEPTWAMSQAEVEDDGQLSPNYDEGPYCDLGCLLAD